MSNKFFTTLITLATLITLISLVPSVWAQKPQKSTGLRGPITALSAKSFVVNNQTINISSTTKLLRKFGTKSSLSEFSVGDNVMVVSSSASASLVRNFSIQKRHGVFFGEIISLEPLAIKTVHRGNQNITPSSSTVYVNRQEVNIILSALQIGHRIRVKGLWDNKLNTIIEVTKIKDYSLPLLPVTSNNATSSSEAR